MTDSRDDPGPVTDRSLADKLNHLFATVRPPGAPEFTPRQVAEEISRHGGAKISGTYLWQLRKGLKDNPTITHVRAIAQFFRVPAAYFLDDEVSARVDQQLALVVALRDAGVRAVALRSSGLSAGSLQTVMTVVEHSRRLEGLNDEGA